MQMIAENDRGWIALDGNEIIVGSKVFDPPKVRLTSPVNADGGGGGVLSFNISRQAGVVQDGHQQDEMAMIRVEQAEDVRGQLGNHKAELNIMLADGSGIGDVVKPFAFVWNAVTAALPEFVTAVAAVLGGHGIGPSPSQPTSPPMTGSFDGAEFQGSKGLFKYARQTDGHDVLYNAAGEAIWASDGGPNGTWLK